MADLRLRDIRQSLGPTEVLGGIALDIPSGAFIALPGASGCGKTTLLRIIAGPERVTTGTVEIAGRDATHLPPERRDIAMMFQSYALLPHLDVAGNVRFPLRMRGIGSAAGQRARVAEALETVQLGHLAARRPRKLSGGQQQRVALARAIVWRPELLLPDEPLSNLDARLREDMQLERIELHRRLGLTTVFVTHDSGGGAAPSRRPRQASASARSSSRRCASWTSCAAALLPRAPAGASRCGWARSIRFRPPGCRGWSRRCTGPLPSCASS